MLDEKDLPVTQTANAPECLASYRAESVRKAERLGYVYVTYKGVIYGPAFPTWEPIVDGICKQTVRVEIEGKECTLWFLDKDIQQ